MRDIKFRGFRNGKWHYGDLVINDGSRTYRIIEDFTLAGNLDNGNYEVYEDSSIVLVHPESVGQFTGLKDKNGKEIYEGDILTEDVSVVFREGKFITTYKGDTQSGSDLSKKRCKYLEVIGNIHEDK